MTQRVVYERKSDSYRFLVADKPGELSYRIYADGELDKTEYVHGWFSDHVRNAKTLPNRLDLEQMDEVFILVEGLTDPDYYTSLDVEGGVAGNPKYLRPFTDKDGNTVYLDAYDLIEGLNITCPAMQHAAKKVMYTGVRGHKDFLTDIKDIEDSLVRAKQLHRVRTNNVQ